MPPASPRGVTPLGATARCPASFRGQHITQLRTGGPLTDWGGWGGMWGLNPRLPEPQSGALPTELIPPQETSLWYQGGASGANARDNRTRLSEINPKRSSR